jgi:hypothetical protein
MSRMPLLAKVSVALFVAAEAVLLATTGLAVWPLMLGWFGVAVLVAGLSFAVRAPWARILIAMLLLPACVFFTFEGGLFMLPAAAFLLAAAVHDRTPQHAIRLHGG